MKNLHTSIDQVDGTFSAKMYDEFNCYKKAGELCKEKGYETVDKDEYQSNIQTNPNMISRERRLVIRCK
jgi:hypothetical protein